MRGMRNLMGPARLLSAGFGLALLGGGLWLVDSTRAQSPAPPANVQQANAVKSPLDQPLLWLQEARKNFAQVQDYTCTLIKRENLRSNPEENIIQAKFRTQPYSVSMRWLTPRKFSGQEVCFCEGRNANKLRVHAKGIKKLAGFVSVSMDDPRLAECSRHSIYDAGIGSLIEQSARQWEADRKLGSTEVNIAEYNFNNRRCLRVETIHTQRRPEFATYRNVVYLDKETKLPVRGEIYSWPVPGGSPDGELLDMVSYVDLRFNVGVGDSEFNK